MREIFDVVDVKSECVKPDVELNVAKFERCNFLLIEFESDFDLVIKLEINFHLRTCENVML